MSNGRTLGDAVVEVFECIVTVYLIFAIFWALTVSWKESLMWPIAAYQLAIGQ